MNSSGSFLNRPASLTVLCVLLWALGAGFIVFAIGAAAAGQVAYGWLPIVESGLVGGVMILAGLGLFQMRRWGVVLFGGLVILGSINHLSNSIRRFPDLSSASLQVAVGAVVSVLGAFLIPFGLIYLTILFWRQTRR